MLIEKLRMDTQDKNRIFGWYYQDKCYYASGAAGYHCVIVLMILLVRAAASTGALVCKMRFEVVIRQPMRISPWRSS